MKKALFVVSLMLLAACGREWEDVKNDWKYTNPCMKGGKYTIIQNNYKIENAKCVYWATKDDDAIFEKNNQKIYVNGSSIIIEERD